MRGVVTTHSDLIPEAKFEGWSNFGDRDRGGFSGMEKPRSNRAQARFLVHDDCLCFSEANILRVTAGDYSNISDEMKQGVMLMFTMWIFHVSSRT